ncbi:MAG: branched-chain amino acid ABC transporter permease [Betaproteobacteria bacterium]|nr:branched-chain amino acid ABC transporter permease [Betaproteobacteria bacterium]
MSRAVQTIVVAIAVMLALLGMPHLGSDYATGIALNVMMWIALVESWSVLSAMTGYVSLGHAVFYGLGAYVVVASWEHLPLYASIPLAGVAGVLFAAAVGSPVMRVRGPYFVILTFGVAELVKYAVLAYESASGVASRILFNGPELNTLYYLMLALAVLAYAIMAVVSNSRFGHGLRAIRENEEAAQSVGVPVVRYKSIAFMLSAWVPAMVGGVMATRSTYFEATQVFDPMVSVTIIAMALIGGGDNARGPLLGVLFLSLLSELLWVNAPQVYMIILGVVLVIFVLLMPEGILGRLARRREGRAHAAT